MVRDKVLIIEDDRKLNDGLKIALDGQNRELTSVYCIQDAWKVIEKGNYQLVILDLNLPDGEGLIFLRDFRKRWETPVLILTAKTLEKDVLAGFCAGANDYVTKPFSLPILRARAEALLKRTKGSSRFHFANFSLDFNQQVFLKADQPLRLNRQEQSLLHFMLVHSGQILTRDQLIDAVWTKEGKFVYENALSVLVKRLRDKMEDDPAMPRWIETVYGIGYRFQKETSSC